MGRESGTRRCYRFTSVRSRYSLSDRSGSGRVPRGYEQSPSRRDRCASMCVSMKMLAVGGELPPCLRVSGANCGTPILVKEWKMLGVPPRRLSRHLSPLPLPVLLLVPTHPNVASEAAVREGTRSREGGNPRATAGVVSREGNLSERGGYSACSEETSRKE